MSSNNIKFSVTVHLCKFGLSWCSPEEAESVINLPICHIAVFVQEN
uniref:Uncharacterized protein n=1 Tax=Anguilla anguilla TaxID=7936 RepID=A0A0E9SAG6_ANGAN